MGTGGATGGSAGSSSMGTGGATAGASGSSSMGTGGATAGAAGSSSMGTGGATAGAAGSSSTMGTGGAMAGAAGSSSMMGTGGAMAGAAGTGGTGMAGMGGSGGSGVHDPGIVSGNSMTLLGAETSIAANGQGEVVVAWISIDTSSGNSTMGYVFSEDYGSTFTAPAFVQGPGGRVGSDPVLVYDSSGNVFMSFVAYSFGGGGNPTQMEVVVAKSAAGSKTFGAAAPVAQNGANGQYDKPWITLTKSGKLLVTYANTATGGIYGAVSSDGGMTWASHPIIDDGNYFYNLTSPCVDETSGRLYATYVQLNQNTGANVIQLRWSDDEGMSWPAGNLTTISNNANVAFEDPTCAAKGGTDVWVAYGLSMETSAMGPTAINASLYSIPVVHSTNGGTSFGMPVEGLDTSSFKLGLIPGIGIEASGALDLSYYAGQSDPDASASVVYRRSTDGGMTWAAPSTIHKPVTFTSDRTQANWVGDYFGMALVNGSIYISYGSNSSGTDQIAAWSGPLP